MPCVVSRAPEPGRLRARDRSSILGTVFRPAEAALLAALARTPEELTAANLSRARSTASACSRVPRSARACSPSRAQARVLRRVAATFVWSALFLAGSSGAAAAGQTEAGRRATSGGWTPRRGFHDLVDPRLRLVIGLYGAQCLVAGALSVLIVATALDLLGLGNAGVGLLQSACGVGAIVGPPSRSRSSRAQAPRRGLRPRPRPLGRSARPDRRAARTRSRWLALAVLGPGNTLVDVAP